MLAGQGQHREHRNEEQRPKEERALEPCPDEAADCAPCHHGLKVYARSRVAATWGGTDTRHTPPRTSRWSGASHGWVIGVGVGLALLVAVGLVGPPR
jgi:hypothetical protein